MPGQRRTLLERVRSCPAPPSAVASQAESGSSTLEMTPPAGPATRVDIKGWQAANAQPDSVCADRRPITDPR
ncbi:hypothetical protein GCM10009566_13840 [Streptomyces murinus]